MHIDKQVTLSILVMLFSSRGTETAKVEGLWLVNRPKHLVPEYPDNSPKAHLCICQNPHQNPRYYESS